MRIQGLMYTDCINLLGSKKSKRLSKNTIIEINDNNYNTVYVILHHSMIVSLHSDGRINISDGGIRSITTKKRINQFLEANRVGYKVIQENNKWFIWKYESTESFNFNGMAFFYVDEDLKYNHRFQDIKR